ncbi:MAG: fused MFS/spermidine synthase, partial [Planctomycetota bacterium]
MTTPAESTSRSGRLLRAGVLALFFLSGVSGLVYEVAWERQLVVVFGNTMLATSTILSAFMAGLAAGSYVFGRYADREGTKLLRTYAILEAGIGGFALVFPLLLSLATPVYTGLYRLLGGNLLGVNLVRFAICLCLVSVPTFLMGGALPVLAKLCSRRSGSLGREVGVLYGLNTLGGFAGCLASGFVLLPAVGISRTTHIAIAINLAVAAVAWAMARRDREEAAPEGAAPPGTQAEHPPEEEYGPSTRSVVKAGILISGFCALAYEVFWSRMLSMVLGSSMYSFTLTVSTFLAGIALGSVIYARFLARVSRQTTVFIVLEFAIGVAAYLTPYTLLLAPRGATTGLLALLRSAALMAGPAVLMGAALPCAVSICRRGKALAGSSVGDVYAMNTVGSVVGPLAAGFVLIPVAGMQKGLLLVAGLNMLAGVMVFASRRMSRARRAACAAALVSLLAVTAILGPTTLFRHLYDRNEPGADVILYEEGAVANVVVYDFHRAGYRDLFLNGSEEASTRLWHIQLFRMLGALPAVVHGDPDDAVMIAFGAGMSAGACVDLVSNLECVELNPDIHEVAEIFARENLNVLRNPKLKLIVNDGRNHLLLTGKRYSLIMSDATNPVSFDAWTLYTREFYRLCKDRLEPGGVFCQWIPTHLPGEAVKTILKTFVSVFPHASVWSVYGSTQCLMLATPERLDIDYAKLRDSLPPVLE